MNNEVISKAFAYNGTNITFARKDGLTMVNATQMAKRFGKRPVDWIKTDSSKRFINTLSEVKKITSTDLVRVTHGDNGSTWMHEDIALEFARWLAPEFAIWCNDRIKELLTTGTTSIETLSRKQLALMVIQAEEEKERLAIENKQQAEQLEEQKPKVTFADAITGSNSYIIIRDLAKLICQNGYEIGEKRLYQWLRRNGYITLDNKPMQRYVEQGLFFLSEGTHSEKGIMRTHMTTKITPKGQLYFINKFIPKS